MEQNRVFCEICLKAERLQIWPQPFSDLVNKGASALLVSPDRVTD